jgi:hypothetical protein
MLPTYATKAKEKHVDGYSHLNPALYTKGLNTFWTKASAFSKNETGRCITLAWSVDRGDEEMMFTSTSMQ